MNFITRDPELDKVKGNASFEIGNYGLVRHELGVNMPINDTVAIRASGASININMMDDMLNFFAEGVKQAGGFDKGALEERLSAVKDWQGITGSVTIDPKNGNRQPATVTIDSVDSKGEFHVDQDWAKAVGAPY